MQDSFGIDPFYYVNWEDPIYDQNEDFSEDVPEVEDYPEDDTGSDADDSDVSASRNNLKAGRQNVPAFENAGDSGLEKSANNAGSSKSGRGSASNGASVSGSNASAIAGVGSRQSKSEPAVKCDAKRCELPACRCGGTAVPGGLPRNNTPQLVMLTFDDAVNDLSKRSVIR